MTIKYGFFNAVNGDRVYNAADIGRYLHSIVSSGVFPTPGSSLQVLAGSGLNIEIQPGRAMLDYHYMENDSTLTLTLAAGGTLARIDTVVARLDLTNRLCEITIKQGTPAVSPVRPTMTRSDTIKEYMLASIRVEKLASAITQENITDTRADSTVCGWVTGLIDQVDTSALFAQFQAAYEARLKAWDELVAGLTGDLSDILGVPIPTTADAGKVPAVKSTGDGYELCQVLPTAGGTMFGTLKTKGLVLTYGVDYGPELPASGVEGQTFILIDE